MTSANDAGYQSITGALESAEPTPTPTHQAPAPPSKSTAGSESASTAPMKHHTTLAGARARNVSGTPSPKSPLSSRDASPARPHQRSTASTGPTNPRAGLPSRKNSADVSPNRGPSLAGPSSSPSAAAIQRALSSTSIPQLQPSSSTDAIKAPRPAKPTSGSNSGDNTPHWPISPRLRSPPPPGSDGRSGSRSRANSLRNQIRKPEAQSTPAIVVQSSSPAPGSRIPVREESVTSDPEEPALSMKGPSRGASGVAPKLETVQESSLPATPGFDGLETDRYAFPATAPLFVMLTHVTATRGIKIPRSTQSASALLTAIAASSRQASRRTEPPTKNAMTSARPRSPKILAPRTAVVGTLGVAATVDTRQRRRARCRSSAQPQHSDRTMSPRSRRSRRSRRAPHPNSRCAT